MPNTTIDFDISDNEPVTQTIHSRVNWADTWTAQSPTLFCRKVKWSVNPDLPFATLHYRYGDVDIADGSFTTYKRSPPVDRGDYIRIDFVGHEIISGDAASKNKSWYGIVDSIEDNDKGVVTINCVGLEGILLETEIDNSIFVDDHDSDVANWQNHRISQVLTFNDSNRKNRSSQKKNSHYGFSAYEIYDDVNGVEYWSTKDIVEYILKTQTPRDSTDTTSIDFELDDTNSLLPDWDSPEVNPDGQKPKSFLDALVSRSRGLCYWLEVESDVVKVKVGTFASQEKDLPISDPPGLKQKQNPNRYIFRTDNLRHGETLVQINNENRFDRVRCVGARAIYCFSLSGPDLSLIEKFKTDLSAKYDQGASTDGSYPASSEIEGRQRADQIARRHYKFRNVYARLGVKLDDPDDATFWSGNVRDGIGTLGESNVAVPEPDESPAVSQKLYPEKFRFLHFIPLRKNFDYIGAGDPASIAEEDDEHGEQYLEPIIAFNRPDDSSKWIDGRRINDLANLENSSTDVDDTTFDFSVVFQPDPNDSAFTVTVQGRPQHIIAPRSLSDAAGNFSDFFQPLPYETNYLSPLTKWNYTTAIFTVAVYGNDFCEGTAGVVNGIKDRVRTKRIDLGNRFQRHHVAKGTVVKIDERNGTLQRRSAAGFVRDDSELAKAVAEFALLWYSLDRASIQLTTQHFGDFQLGSIVSSLKTGNAVTFDPSTDRMTVTGAPYETDDAIVFYVDDASYLAAPLTPGNIYFVTSVGGDEYTLSHQRGGTPIDLITGSFGNVFATDNGANTPITSIELDLPVIENSDDTGFSQTTISTGHSNFDVHNFF